MVDKELHSVAQEDELIRSFKHIFILLLGLGCICMFSASYHFAYVKFQTPYHYLIRQIGYILMGLLTGGALMCMPRSLVRALIKPLVVITVLMLFLPFSPLGVKVLGARRWFRIAGFTFQSSEMLKLAVPFFFAHLYTKRVNPSLSRPLIALGFLGFSALLVLLQNDFSSAVILVLYGLIILIVLRIPALHMLSFVGGGILFSVIAILSKPHRIRRILSFLNPDIDPQGAGYQVRIAKEAIMRGGFWGQGLGESHAKLGSLPVMSSDFIFSVMSEEIGFVGVVLFVSLFIAFAYFGFRLALAALARKDRFGFLISFSMILSVVLQVLVHMGIVSGFLPATGLPLPFYSQGGSNILITVISVFCVFWVAKGRYNDAFSDAAVPERVLAFDGHIPWARWTKHKPLEPSRVRKAKRWPFSRRTTRALATSRSRGTDPRVERRRARSGRSRGAQGTSRRYRDTLEQRQAASREAQARYQARVAGRGGQQPSRSAAQSREQMVEGEAFLRELQQRSREEVRMKKRVRNE